MIAGYIKFFTRWVNSWIYGISTFIAACIKSMMMFFIQYTVGIALSSLGYKEVSLYVISYLNSISEVTFAGIFIHTFILMFFTWYYLNSSIYPIVRVKDYSTDHCQMENLEIQLNELKEKSGKESEEMVQIKSKFDEEQEKTEKVVQENTSLKEKVKENESDKKKVAELQDSIKLRDDEIEIKACKLDKLQITLQASKEDVERCKSEYNELETKFFNAIKELDIKDCSISDFEDGEKEFNSQLSSKNKEIEEKEQLVKDLYEQINDLEKQIVDLEDALGEEKKISHAIRLEKEVLEETSLNINKISETTSESQTDSEDAVKVAEQLKAERLAMLTDASKIKIELSETKSELASCKEELEVYKQKSIDMEDKYNELAAKFEALCNKTDKLKTTVERKDIEIATITKFFTDRENELQTTTMKQTEEIQKLTKELSSIGEDRRQIVELNKQITDLKEEITSNEKNFKHQVAVLEEESHANYLKMRTSARECEEHKREKEIYRKKLLENDMKPINKNQSLDTNASLSVNASLDISDRSESPGSNKSTEGVNDPNRLPASGNPVRPPMHFPPPMYRGMPPFPPRPMGTPPFRMPPRMAFSGPPRPYMPVLRQPPPNVQNNMTYPGPGYQQTPPTTNVRGATNTTTFNGQEYVNTLIDNLATKDNIRKDLFEKQNKTVL